jgi:hypothetical protein
MVFIVIKTFSGVWAQRTRCPRGRNLGGARGVFINFKGRSPG